MGPDFTTIVEQYKFRKSGMHPAMEAMRELKDVYKGDVTIPLPELDKSERSGVANLIQTGLDQLSMRVASTAPDVWFPPDTPGKKRDEVNSRMKRKVTIGWWTTNKMRLVMRKRARWLIGYGISPVMLRPDPEIDMPRWHPRDPLTCFPPLGADNLHPRDCIFTQKRSLAWLQQNYPQAISRLDKGAKPKPDDMYDVLEYVDDECWVLGVAGPSRQTWDRGAHGTVPSVEIWRMPNRIGTCPVVIPERISLDNPQGQFQNAIGMYKWQARLMALEVISVERNIFPDTYLISRPNEVAAFVDGPYDGRTGKINIVKGGDIKDMSTQTPQMTNVAIDRLERAQRLTGGMPAELGGESTSNIRTGRRGDSVLSAVIDFPVQEAQEIFQESLAEENKIAIAIDREYFDKPKSFYINIKGAKGLIQYTPSETFTSDVNFVTFAHAGADSNQLTVALGQKLGTGQISRFTAMQLDPMIDDPEFEHDQIIKEAIEQSILASIQQQATTGALPLPDLANIMTMVKTNKKDLVDAVIQAQKDAQERQAQQVEPGAAEGQPGLALPGQGAEAGTGAPAPAGPGGDLASLPALLAQLRGAPAIQQTRATVAG